MQKILRFSRGSGDGTLSLPEADETGEYRVWSLFRAAAAQLIHSETSTATLEAHEL